MKNESNLKEDLIYRLIIVAVSFLIGWLMMGPFVDFLSDKIQPPIEQVVPTNVYPPKIEPAQIQLLPNPTVNYTIPCDDTDCGREVEEQGQVI